MSTDAQSSTPASAVPSSGVARCTDRAPTDHAPVESPSTTRSGNALAGLLDLAVVGFQMQWEDGGAEACLQAFVHNTADELEILQTAMASDTWTGDDELVQDRIAIVVAKMRAVTDLVQHLKASRS